VLLYNCAVGDKEIHNSGGQTMSWRFAAFKFLFRAELCKKSLEEAGIKTDSIFRTGEDDYWYVPWQPRSKAEYYLACAVVAEHID
jgi:hypothetical protein